MGLQLCEGRRVLLSLPVAETQGNRRIKSTGNAGGILHRDHQATPLAQGAHDASWRLERIRPELNRFCFSIGEMGLCVNRAKSDVGHRARPVRRRTSANRKPDRDGRFRPISALLVLEYALACPSSSQLELDRNRFVRTFQFGPDTLQLW